MNRGIITHKERARQLRDYSGLRYGAITPTDIDGLIEYKDKAYVIYEFKFGDVEITRGQMLAIERLCDDLQKYKMTIVIIARHNQPVDKEIDAANAIVEKYRLQGKWVIMKNVTEKLWTCKALTDWFLSQPLVINSDGAR